MHLWKKITGLSKQYKTILITGTVLVAIGGGLALISDPNSRFRNHDPATVGLVRLQNAIYRHILDLGYAPEELDDLLLEYSVGGSTFGPFASQADLMDPWGQRYHCRRVSYADYRIWTLGADNQKGGWFANRDREISLGNVNAGTDGSEEADPC